jgi:hypothetical protein
MNIEEIKAKKAALESSISSMLLEFTRETSARVDIVYLDDVVAEMGGKPVAYIVKLDVRL